MQVFRDVTQSPDVTPARTANLTSPVQLCVLLFIRFAFCWLPPSASSLKKQIRKLKSAELQV
jgi:hypothetical protein